MLDLGAGDGALTSAAAKVWKEARYYTVDIDKCAQSSKLQALYGPSFVHHVGDALEFDIGKKLGLKSESADIALCNPPYIRPKWKKSFAAILEEAGLSGSYGSLGDVPADVLFIAQNLRFLRTGGRLGVIVPDGVVAGENCALLRHTLATSHCIQKVIELPRNIFSRTDAKTHIVILSKGSLGTSEIEIQQLMSDGNLSEAILLPRERASHRLDYAYLSERLTTSLTPALAIKDVVEVLKRGAISSAERNQTSYPVVHTSDISSEKSLIDKSFFLSESQLGRVKGPIAKRGDILMARVGRNLHDKVFMVTSKNVAVSDCIFVLRVKQKYRSSLFAYLRSSVGRKALKSATRGVSARFLTAAAILEIPIREENAS